MSEHTEHTEQTAAPNGAVPARIDLEDFIEAATRGVARALAAQEEVSGYFFKAGERPVGTGTPGSVRPVPTQGNPTTGLIFNFNLLSS